MLNTLLEEMLLHYTACMLFVNWAFLQRHNVFAIYFASFFTSQELCCSCADQWRIEPLKHISNCNSLTLNDQVDHISSTSLFQEVPVLLWFLMRMETPLDDMISISTRSPTDLLLSIESSAPGPINYTSKWDFFTQTHKHKYTHCICIKSICWHVHHSDV